MELTVIKGVGEKTVPRLNKLGIYSIKDLIDFLPSKYLDMTSCADLDYTSDGEYVLLRGVITSVTKVQYIRRNMNVFKAKFSVQSRTLTLTWFNSPYLREKILSGEEYTVWGKLVSSDGILSLVNPSFEKGKGERLSGITPIYPTKNIIAQPTFHKFVAEALKYARYDSVTDLAEDNALPLCKAYAYAHFPESVEQAREGRRRLNKELLTAQILAYKINKEGCAGVIKSYEFSPDIINPAVEKLPFELSPSQRTALKEICDDMHSGNKMNRLLAGDVGSGKTVVALMAALYAVKCGYQVAIMAPTEILARQHYGTAVKLLSGHGVRIGVLTGESTAAEKRTCINNIKSGNTDILIGTHAVIGDKVEFCNLGLIVIDELQRFGVRHKSSLENKARSVDVLVMSATPIPRAMALTIYGDLQLSSLAPRGDMGSNITTKVVGDDKLEDVYAFIHKRIDNGEQAYIVCPLVEDSEGLERMSVKKLYAKLVAGSLRGVSVGLVYSGMKESLKAEVMRKFYQGEIKVLVATTVIEVGIDCALASVMLILNADCFGLATLHQLRGRIGRRAGLKSYCILHTSVPGENERLRQLSLCNDGFDIAQIDADMRGYGDFLGLRQSGRNNELARIDAGLIAECRNLANKLYEDYPEQVSENQLVNSYVSALKDISLS